MVNNLKLKVNKNLTNIATLYNILPRGDLGQIFSSCRPKNFRSNDEDCHGLRPRKDIETFLFFHRKGAQGWAARMAGKLKKVLLVAVTAWANSGRGICFSSAKKLAVWIIRAGSLVFCFRIGSGDR